MRHIGKYGGLNLTEIRKFNSVGKLVWLKTIDMNRDEMHYYYQYNSSGQLNRTIEIDSNFRDTLKIIEN